ncbi:MAG TPA: hypothetical protein VGH90_02570 [Chthoniobacteraceae bacterium]
MNKILLIVIGFATLATITPAYSRETGGASKARQCHARHHHHHHHHHHHNN